MPTLRVYIILSIDSWESEWVQPVEHGEGTIGGGRGVG